MARQAGDVLIEGTVDDLTYYRMQGEYYVRMKSSLTGKSFWKSKAFEGARRSCKRFAEANKLASRLYRNLEAPKRNYKLFCYLKKRAIQLLKMGKSQTDAEEFLIGLLIDFGLVERKRTRALKGNRISFSHRLQVTYSLCQSERGETLRMRRRQKQKARVYSLPNEPRSRGMPSPRATETGKYYKSLICMCGSLG